MSNQNPVLKFSDSENNIELELSIVGYQFPSDSTDNWCLLKASISQVDNIFVVNDPALEAMDLVAILNWFRCLSNRQLPRYGTLTFTEPCITFEFLACQENSVRIAISLSNEMQPDFKFKQFGIVLVDCSLCFDLDSNDFTQIIKNLEALIKLYPTRRDD